MSRTRNPIGICLAPTQSSRLAEGFDYVELQVAPSLLPLDDEAIFLSQAAKTTFPELRVDGFNCFVPGVLKVVGPAVDWQAIGSYVRRAIDRAAWRGAHFIVFGSGEARRVPDGFPRAVAWSQLVRFLKLCAEVAKPHGVTIAIEPLNRSESNILNTYTEAVLMAEEVGCHAQVQVLADIYHFMVDEEPLEDILLGPEWLAHVHVADTNNRYPGSGDYPLARLFAILKDIGYSGRVSIECIWCEYPAIEARSSLHLLRQLSALG
jgi:sugar phosphate isomerase/epimerase